jgi:hypothetical protein
VPRQGPLALVALLALAPIAGAGEYLIDTLSPPVLGFYSKFVRAHGVVVRAHDSVDDEALRGVAAKLGLLLEGLPPEVEEGLQRHSVTMSVLGRDQRPTDLPENAHWIGKSFDRYEGSFRPSWAEGPGTLDSRVTGLGGREAFCPEDDGLLEHEGRLDVCLHEWVHVVHQFGLSERTQEAIRVRFQQIQDSGHWADTYARVNELEFFAEATTWYFGAHGGGQGFPEEAYVEPGPEWLRWYDPQTHELIDAVFRRRDRLAHILSRIPAGELAVVLASARASLAADEPSEAWSEAREAFRSARRAWSPEDSTPEGRAARMRLAIEALGVMEQAAEAAGREDAVGAARARRREIEQLLAEEAPAAGPSS